MGLAEKRMLAGLRDDVVPKYQAELREITADKIGKEAVASGVKKIHLSQGKDANITAFTLTDGVLNMPWDWEGWPGSFFPDSVREKIEAML